MHSKSHNIEFMPNDKGNEVVNKLFKSLLSRYQTGLETSITWTVLFPIQFNCCIINVKKIIFKLGRSYIDSPDQVEKKKGTTNPENKCFKYVVTVALNYGNIKLHAKRGPHIKPFINKYNWKRTHYQSKTDDWKRFGKNKTTIALNVLYIKEREICPCYISKDNSTHEKEITILMIPSEKKRIGYLAVKKLSALLYEIKLLPITKEELKSHQDA